MTIYTDNSESLPEILEHANIESIESAFLKIQKDFEHLAEQILENKEKNEKNLVLQKFIKISISYLELARSNHDGLVQVLSFCARNLYEIYLWVRYIKKHPDNLKKWLIEAEIDKRDINDCIIAYIHQMSIEDVPAYCQEGLSYLEKDNKRIDIFLKEENDGQKKNLRIGEIANAVDQENEKIFFKLFSKLVHPTSYFVNGSPTEIQNIMTRKLLFARIQLYSKDIYREIKQAIVENEIY